MKRLISLLLVTTIALSGCAFTDFFRDLFSNITGGSLPTKQIILQIQSADLPLTVEVADSTEEREQGLMNREKLEEGNGMLFVFSDESPREFWMKNTLIPLDILFFDSKKKVVHIVENMVPCREAQCVSYPSKDPAMYALELRGGFVDNYKVKVGDMMLDTK